MNDNLTINSLSTQRKLRNERRNFRRSERSNDRRNEKYENRKKKTEERKWYATEGNHVCTVYRHLEGMLNLCMYTGNMHYFAFFFFNHSHSPLSFSSFIQNNFSYLLSILLIRMFGWPPFVCQTMFSICCSLWIFQCMFIVFMVSMTRSHAFRRATFLFNKLRCSHLLSSFIKFHYAHAYLLDITHLIRCYALNEWCSTLMILILVDLKFFFATCCHSHHGFNQRKLWIYLSRPVCAYMIKPNSLRIWLNQKNVSIGFYQKKRLFLNIIDWNTWIGCSSMFDIFIRAKKIHFPLIS